MRTIRDIFCDYAVLNAEGIHVYGTDRESNHHYGDAYESILSVPEMYDAGLPLAGCRPRSIREDVELMLEVVVADGASLRAWREVFPNARIVGMDLVEDAFARLCGEDRIEFRVGDATKREDCEIVVAGRQFDLIVDDASHQIEDVLRTLFWLWSAVRPGGLYIIEDLNTCLDNWQLLFPQASIVDTTGPWGGYEPLIVLRKPL